MTPLVVSNCNLLQGAVQYVSPRSNSFLKEYPNELQQAIDFMLSDPEAISLLNDIVNKIGTISIQFSADLERCAKHDFSKNQILLRRNQDLSLKNLVPYIFFELQNAKQCSEFLDLQRQALKISKERYVVEVEKLEYNSALATHLYVKKLAEKGILPRGGPYYYCFSSFEDHYLYQQLTGHSELIANGHPSNEPYRGTWIAIPREEERPILKNLLISKALVQSGTPDEQIEAKKQVMSILDKVDGWVKDYPFSPLVVSLDQNVKCVSGLHL